MITTVYILTAILVTNQFVGGPKVEVAMNVFEDAARCLKNVEINQAELEKKYYQVRIYCTPRDIVKGKK